ncbi:DUF4190 domain-containing protein [Nocardioides litoris]|uniref:DUF4190 domain-containing protein n=1 Tax=Nocardioides litoris TaxID=1926648 RepID=UPI001B864FC7|nr:DUF4190 domain-containing protein [Nocardioides litoris]
MSYGAPPPSSPYGGSPYGGGPYGGYGGGTAEHPQGTTILVLGIIGLVACMPLGIAAWVMGNKALREIDSSPMTYTNRGSVRAGQICGMIATILAIVAVLFYVVVIVVVLGASSS